MNAFLPNILAFLNRLTLPQRITLGAVLVGGTAALIAVAIWANQPDYALLFGKVEPSDANRVIEALQEQNIKYDLRENGTAIFVPRDKVYELRLQFAGEGIISEGPDGYELFDQGTLGMTDFMQKLNFKRALEGELARTISNLQQVEICRVHLVMPERSPFRQTQTPPSASVVLQYAKGKRLTAAQIEGITALVSGAVEGLTPADVTVLDTRGNLLSDPDASNSEVSLTSNQLRIQTAMENHLTEKGQSMLDQVLGINNAIVRVTATLDFSTNTTENLTLDPESGAIISEERQDVQGDVETANGTVRNYSYSETRQRSEKSVGNIEFLTISVILNHKKNLLTDEEGETTVEYINYEVTELTEIEELVKNAVGFNTQRGDSFAIHQTRFDTTIDDEISAEQDKKERNQQIETYARYGLMVVAILLALWLIRSASQRAQSLRPAEPVLLAEQENPAALEAPGNAKLLSEGEAERIEFEEEEEEEEYDVEVEDFYSSKLSPEARKRLKAKHKLFELIKEQMLGNPDQAAELLRSWLNEETFEGNVAA